MIFIRLACEEEQTFNDAGIREQLGGPAADTAGWSSQIQARTSLFFKPAARHSRRLQ
jgi:hypothetical protein